MRNLISKSGYIEDLFITGSDGQFHRVTTGQGGGGGGVASSNRASGYLLNQSLLTTSDGILGKLTISGAPAENANLVLNAPADYESKIVFEEQEVAKWTIGNDGDGSDGFRISAGSNLNTPYLTVTSDGKAGFGTTEPMSGSTLSVSGATYSQSVYITGADGTWGQVLTGGGGGTTINSGISFQTSLTSGVSSQVITFPEALSAIPQVACTIVNSGDGGVIPFSISGTTNSQYVVDFTQVIPNDDYAINTLIGGGSFTSTGGSVWETGASDAVFYTGGNVGIGLASPATDLQIKAKDGEDDAVIGFSSADGTQNAAIAHMDEAGSERLSFRVGGLNETVAHMAILNNGNIGVGTALADAKLTIGVSNSDDGILLSGSQRAVRIYQDGTSSNGRLALYKSGEPWSNLKPGLSYFSGTPFAFGHTSDFFDRQDEWNATLSVQASGAGATGLRVTNAAHDANLLSVDNEGLVYVNNKVGIGPGNSNEFFGTLLTVNGEGTDLTASENRLQIGTEGSANRYCSIGFGYANTNVPAYIGYETTDGASFTKGDLIFGTRGVVTDSTPTEQLRLNVSGKLLMNSNHQGLRVSNVPTANRNLMPDTGPTAPLAGEMIYNTTVGEFQVYDGFNWHSLTTGTIS